MKTVGEAYHFWVLHSAIHFSKIDVFIRIFAGLKCVTFQLLPTFRYASIGCSFTMPRYKPPKQSILTPIITRKTEQITKADCNACHTLCRKAKFAPHYGGLVPPLD